MLETLLPGPIWASGWQQWPRLCVALRSRHLRIPNNFHLKGTPHRGVSWNPLPGIEGSSGWLHHFFKTSQPVDPLLVLAGIFRCVFDTDFGGAGNLSQRFMIKFNKRTPNNPNVRYYSWAGETSIPMAGYMSVVFYPFLMNFSELNEIGHPDTASPQAGPSGQLTAWWMSAVQSGDMI